MQGLVCCDECYNVNIKYGLITIHSRLLVSLGPPSILFTHISINWRSHLRGSAISNQCALKIPVLSLLTIYTESVETCQRLPAVISINTDFTLTTATLSKTLYSFQPLCPLLPKIEFNSFWSLTNPIAIVYRFGLTPTDSKLKRDRGESVLWIRKNEHQKTSSSSCERGKSLINKFHFSRCWTQFREWFVFFHKRKVLDLFSKQNGLFFCWFSFCRFTSWRWKQVKLINSSTFWYPVYVIEDW